MSYFKDQTGGYHFLENDNFEYLLPAGSVKVETPQNLGPTLEQRIKEQIAVLEFTVTPRRIREATLGTDEGWLKNVDSQITTLRQQLKDI